ncbi:helix-turn-helix transcriptional regulator [Microbispora sp. ATCC PTA-5024]|uniref:helix-turn-helix transcriptional regulator n=1 Tax=Microbispora sp. ATCC PTA-5024 TaxID=316330 RepID=UPI0022B6F44E|nr:LuxR family transcriptional regulator [Microbispora sp. ATCC PTA-5024]
MGGVRQAPATVGESGSLRSSWPGWRGRTREWDVVLGMLGAAQAGRGGVLLIEGRPGTGKSRLLDEAAASAERSGLWVARGVADELTQLIPLAPLMAALGAPARSSPVGESGPGPGDQRLLLVDYLQEPLERRVAQGPVLLMVDDVHWADPMTLLALRSMTRDLATYPLVWMLSRTSGGGAGRRIERLFDLLERDGANRITLRALDEAAVADVATDVLGAVPEPDVLALTHLADGNPFLLVDLLEKLKAEGVVQVAGGHARMVSARLPRVHEVTRERLEELSNRTRHLLQVAAILGRSFSVQDLAEMLGESSSGLLPMLEEALSAGVVEPSGDELAFRHDVLWQTVLAALPTAVRRALHHDAGQMLLKRGGSAVPAATHLIHGATRGDGPALMALDRAAREVLYTSPQTAADLALRALDLSDCDGPDWCARAATAVDALTAIGRLTEAADLARDALTRAAPEQAARLRRALAYNLLLSGHPAEAVTESERLLEQEDLADELRGCAEWGLFWGLISLGDLRKGRVLAEAVLHEVVRHTDAAVVGALLLLARCAIADGRIADSFAHLYEAIRIADTGTVQPIQRPYARLLMSLHFRALRHYDAADIAAQAAEEDIRALGLTVFAAQPALFRACLKLATGRLDDAATEAHAALMIADEVGAHGFVRVALSMLALIAVRRGDIDAALRHIEQYPPTPPAPGMLYGSGLEQWVTAAVAEAQGDAGRAMEILQPLYADPAERRCAILVGPLSTAWMTRLALATANRPYAQAILKSAEHLARRNPDAPIFAAAAAHARGLLHRDADALAFAADNHPQPWERASGAEDLGVLLAASPEASARERAVESLDRALDGYQGIGAHRDAARVRARLRELGVRRRHWAGSTRPAFGWESLTDTERTVAMLIARGMTNRQAAARMFLSHHTVSTHLRRIFGKLQIASRVELARIVTEQYAIPDG